MFTDSIQMRLSDPETEVRRSSRSASLRVSAQMVAMPRSAQRGGLAFTLVELLMVIAVIAILAGLLAGGANVSMSRAKGTRCISNLQQLIRASIMYSAEDRMGAYSSATDTGDRDMNYLLKHVGNQFTVFVCPATRNSVTHQKDSSGRYEDLTRLAPGTSGVGLSYFLSGFMGWRTPHHTDVMTPEGSRRVYSVLKTEQSVATYVHFNEHFGLKGAMPGPANVYLFVDNTIADVPRFPTTAQNHDPSGAHAAFLDGSVRWISGTRFPYVHELSTDDGRYPWELNH